VTPDILTTRNEKKNSTRNLFFKIPPTFRNDLKTLAQVNQLISNWTKAKEIWAPIIAAWNQCHDLMNNQNTIKKANNFSNIMKEKKCFSLSTDEEDCFESSDIDEPENDNDISTELIYDNSSVNSLQVDKKTINKEKAKKIISISNKDDQKDIKKKFTVNNLQYEFIINNKEYADIMDIGIAGSNPTESVRGEKENFNHKKEQEKIIANTDNKDTENDEMSPKSWEIRFLDNNDSGIFYIILYYHDKNEILFPFKTLYFLLGVNSLG
jgi:hypothetical protein